MPQRDDCWRLDSRNTTSEQNEEEMEKESEINKPNRIWVTVHGLYKSANERNVICVSPSPDGMSVSRLAVLSALAYKSIRVFLLFHSSLFILFFLMRRNQLTYR